MDGGVFRVSPAPVAAEPADGWQSIFAVYAGQGDVPPLLGAYSVEGGSLVFRPRFPLSPGLELRAVFHSPTGAAVTQLFHLPKAAPLAATTRVAHIYPSNNVLPANELKFYVYFTAPMSKGEVWRHVRLLRENGSKVEVPFLELDQELWDRENQRVTLLLDPGRIKRGLASLAEEGPALEEGARYTLVVDRDWPDAHGTPLAEEFRKPFRVTEADRKPPQVTDWRIMPPRAGSKDALIVEFPKPLDYALLQHMIEVKSGTEAVAGSFLVERDETRWRFTPTQPWTAGDYKLVVQTALEDLAGNHIGRAFDVDTFDSVTQAVTTETVSVPFRIRQQ